MSLRNYYYNYSRSYKYHLMLSCDFLQDNLSFLATTTSAGMGGRELLINDYVSMFEVALSRKNHIRKYMVFNQDKTTAIRGWTYLESVNSGTFMLTL